MTDPVDPDLEAAAEALWVLERGREWANASSSGKNWARSRAVVVLAALRAAGWQKEGEGRVRFRAHIEDRLHELVVEPDEARTWAELKHLLRWLDGLAPVGEMRRTSEASSDTTRGAAFSDIEDDPSGAVDVPSIALPSPRMGAAQAAAEGNVMMCLACGSEHGYGTPHVAAPMSPAVLGDETSTSGGVGIPSAAVPEQPKPSAFELKVAHLPIHWRDRANELERAAAGSGFAAERLRRREADVFRYCADELEGIRDSIRGVSDSEAGQ